MKKLIQKNSGITIVALAVTIVVLLILAGITVSGVISDNGIIKKAQEAKDATEDNASSTSKDMNSLAQELSGERRTTATPSDVLKGKTFLTSDGKFLTGTLEQTGGVNVADATATADKVLSGYTFYAGNGTKKTGTLVLPKGTNVSDANAQESQVLSGVTFYAGSSSTRRTGSMVNQGNWSKTVKPGTSTTIPAGYHNGSGTVSVDLSSETVTQSKVMSDVTFYAQNGSLQSGNIENKGAWSGTVAAGSSINIPAGYHNGNGVVSAIAEDLNLTLTETLTPNTSAKTTVSHKVVFIVSAYDYAGDDDGKDQIIVVAGGNKILDTQKVTKWWRDYSNMYVRAAAWTNVPANTDVVASGTGFKRCKSFLL